MPCQPCRSHQGESKTASLRIINVRLAQDLRSNWMECCIKRRKWVCIINVRLAHTLRSNWLECCIKRRKWESVYHQHKVSTGFKEELNGMLHKNVENESLCIINVRLAQDLRRNWMEDASKRRKWESAYHQRKVSTEFKGGTEWKLDAWNGFANASLQIFKGLLWM